MNVSMGSTIAHIGLLAQPFLFAATLEGAEPSTQHARHLAATPSSQHSPAHTSIMGLPLQVSSGEAVTGDGRCPVSAPVRRFDIAAINVEITINRFMHYFPGYLYVLTEDLERVRREEKRNARARLEPEGSFPTGPSHGLQTDLILPLILRVNVGDCVRILLRNQTENEGREPVGFHLHSSSLVIRSSGLPATMIEKTALVAPGKRQEFEWFVTPGTAEGAHPFHSHATREQWGLGLFGALIVEPAGSRHLDPLTGQPLTRGWSAIIEDPKGADFREFVIIYHELGSKDFRLNDRDDLVSQRDLFTDAYAPGHFALNMRSESHGTRLELQEKRHAFHDASLAYSSYTFGDPGTPIPRSYLGDPVKFRVVGGAETIHSHHLHGGADRWPRSPEAVTVAEFNFAATANGTGPVKFPAIRTSSDRVDVQPIGAGEAFNQVIECGSGGCQYGAGDYLLHCHIAQHYIGGMWTFWRVYNTLQTTNSSDDLMPPLRELPDRGGRMKPAVASEALIGRTVDWFGGKKFLITSNHTDWRAEPARVSIKQWVEMMLPSQGRPGNTSGERQQIAAYDATVLDWTWRAATALGEPETEQIWEAYRAERPGARLPIRFDPLTGKPSLPYLRPHLGKRPPFARDHSPAPFLEPIHRGASGEPTVEPAQPGENGPWSLCPEGSPHKAFTINAVPVSLTLKSGTRVTRPIVDPDGMLYVLEEEEEQVLKDPKRQVPLAIRANVYDCVDVLFKSKLKDDARVSNASKVNIHPHLFQFDITGSDGVIAGFNYEQSVRPYTVLHAVQRDADPRGLPVPQNTTLSQPARAGDKTIRLAATVRQVVHASGTFEAPMFHPGTVVGIGMNGVGEFEARRIAAIQDNEINLTEPLERDHAVGAIVSVEFMRYRWYPDVDLGTVFWHDHVFGIDSWGHGLFGSTIVEPPGSTYHDPATGKEIRSGLVADIHTTEPVSAAVKGSFREVVLQWMDTNPRTAELITADNPMSGRQTVDGTPSAKYPLHLNRSPMTFLNGGEATTGGGIGMKVEPLSIRLANRTEPYKLFWSGGENGDPETPLVQAYLGDPIVFRTLVGSTNEIHTWHVSGHLFPSERYQADSLQRNTVHLGIADRFDAIVPSAGGPQRMSGDYLYHSGRASHFAEGSWGLIRVLPKSQERIRPLPSREEIPEPSEDICPADAPLKEFSVSAVDYPLRHNAKAPETYEISLGRRIVNSNPDGKVYILDRDLQSVKRGTLRPHPLTLRVNVGDCIKITLTNRLANGRVGLHIDGLAYDPKTSMGVVVGENGTDQSVEPGRNREYTFYAHPEFGENAALIQDWGDVLLHPRNGLYGVVIVGPRGSRYLDPKTGADVGLGSVAQADVIIDRTVSGNQNRRNYRDAVLIFQDEDNLITTSFMPYSTEVAGISAVNYGSVPYWPLVDSGCSESELFACAVENGYLGTPVLEAHAGDPLLIHVLGGFNEKITLFSLEGHTWPIEPFAGAHRHSTFELGGTSYLRVRLETAGGPGAIPGDYAYLNHLSQNIEAGQWGVLRVLPPGDRKMLALDRSDVSARPVSDISGSVP